MDTQEQKNIEEFSILKEIILTQENNIFLKNKQK